MNDNSLWTKNFIVILVINFMLFLGFEMFAITLPIHIRQIGGSDSTVGLSIGIFTVAALVARAITGVSLDRFGRKAIFIIGLCAMALITLGYNFIVTMVLFMILRVIHGVSWGISSTASSTIASDLIPKKRFGEGMGYFGLSNSLAMAAGPGIGLFIIVLSSFGTLFAISAATLVLSILLVFVLKYKTNDTPQEAPKGKATFYEKNAILPATVCFFLCATYGSLVSFLALFGEQEGIGNVGLFFTVYAAVMLLSRPIAGKATDRYGFNVVVFPGLVLMAIGMVVLSMSHGIVPLLVSAGFYGIGFGAAQSALQAMAVISAPANRIGAANATFFVGFDAGIGVGSVVAGFIASAAGYGIMYLSFVAFIAAAGVFFFFMQAKKKSLHHKAEDSK